MEGLLGEGAFCLRPLPSWGAGGTVLLQSLWFLGVGIALGLGGIFLQVLCWGVPGGCAV